MTGKVISNGMFSYNKVTWWYKIGVDIVHKRIIFYREW